MFDSESGTTNLKKPAYGLVFCFWQAGLSIELRSIHSSHPCDSPCGQRDALCKNAPGVFVRSGHHAFKETSLRAGFLLLERRTFHRTAFHDSPHTALVRVRDIL